MPLVRKALALATILLLLACAAERAREADRPYTAGLAEVESVEIEVQRLAPASAWARVRGHLPDPCTALESADVRRSGSIFRVVLPTRRPFGALCEPMTTPFETRIRLDVDTDHSGAYVVTVNGVSQSFAVNLLHTGPLL
jgi:hypothetical protein